MAGDGSGGHRPGGGDGEDRPNACCYFGVYGGTVNAMTLYPDPTFYHLLAHLLRRRPYCKRAATWRRFGRARLPLSVMEACYE